MISSAPESSEHPARIARDIDAIGQMQAVPTLLRVLCRITGMRFAAVARVTEASWTACAVQDEINFGLKAGGQLPIETTLCREVRDQRRPIVITQVSQDGQYCGHPTPRIYGFESYISVPIVLSDGGYFGNLCALDPAPAHIDEKILDVFTSFAELIANHLDTHSRHEQVQSALNDAHAASELREQFIAILGHDLRNPLQAVMAAGQYLEHKSPDPVLKGVAARIRNNVKRMSALIDDVLDFARGRLGGGIELQIRPVEDVDAGLAAIVREFQDGQPDRRIEADIRVARQVRCDLGRIQQVASNLIGNALAHGDPSKPVTIKVGTEGDSLHMSVWNDGEPIPAESLGKIFEPFWRASTSASRQGLGLGLHICSQIVRAHGGSIRVQSDKATGTRFIVRLPLEPSVTSDASAPGSDGPQGA